MTRPRQIIPLCLALILGAAPVFAQPGSSEPTATPGNGAKPQSPAPSPNENPEKAADTDAGANPKQRSNSGGDSPYDYRASEEISEDLPVSFPVDI
jgi:hypothetical protein